MDLGFVRCPRVRLVDGLFLAYVLFVDFSPFACVLIACPMVYAECVRGGVGMIVIAAGNNGGNDDGDAVGCRS